MNKKNLTVLIAAAVAVIMVSCSSSNPYISNTKSNLQHEQYDSALASSKRFIQSNPHNPIGYYYEGVALGEKGQAQDDPGNATPMFKQMNKAFGKAQATADTLADAPGEIGNIGSVKRSLWRKQHNSAVALAKSDSLKQTVSNPMERTVAYLHNATIIAPDSALSWNVLAIIQNQRNKYGQAAQAQQKYISLEDSVSARDYLLLSQFYQLNKQSSKAMSVLEEAHKKFPNSNKLVERLADAYNNNGKPEKSISIVSDLVKQNPQNPQYHLALGTQIYKSSLIYQKKYDKNTNKVLDLQQKMHNNQGNSSQIKQQIKNLQKKNAQLEDKMNSLINRAVDELHQTLKYRQKDKKAYFTLGVIYQNEAKTYFNKRNMTLDNAEAKQDNDKANQLLKKAADNYNQAAKIDPNNKKYWKNLYDVYNALGMDQKAKEAKQKAGMQ